MEVNVKNKLINIIHKISNLVWIRKELLFLFFYFISPGGMISLSLILDCFSFQTCFQYDRNLLVC